MSRRFSALFIGPLESSTSAVLFGLVESTKDARCSTLDKGLDEFLDLLNLFLRDPVFLHSVRHWSILRHQVSGCPVHRPSTRCPRGLLGLLDPS